MPSVADVWLDLRTDDRKLGRDIEKGATRADTRKAGRSAGQRFSMGFNEGTRTAGRQLGGLMADLTGVGAATQVANRRSTMFLKVLGAVNVATGVGEAAVSALTVTVGSLAAGLTSAGAGAGAYGIALMGLLKQEAALQKAQKLAVGGTKAQKQAYQDMLKSVPPAVRQFNKAFDQMTQGYSRWSDALAKPVLAPLIGGMKLASPMLKAITPLVRAEAGALGELMDELARKVQGGGLERFVSTVLPYVRPITLSLVHALANTVGGLWGVIRAFLPFSTEVTGGLEKMTARFRDWSATLSSHSGFQALITQWRRNWPLVREGLGDLLKILTNIVSSLAGMSTPQNSRLLWQIANPLLALAVKLSASPALVTTFLYLWMISKGAGRLKGVFDGLKAGWGGLASVVSMLTGGKVSLGMQTAGDTMVVAANRMQGAADTMIGAGAGGAARAGGGAAAGAAAGGAAGLLGRVAPWLRLGIGALFVTWVHRVVPAGRARQRGQHHLLAGHQPVAAAPVGPGPAAPAEAAGPAPGRARHLHRPEDRLAPVDCPPGGGPRYLHRPEDGLAPVAGPGGGGRHHRPPEPVCDAGGGGHFQGHRRVGARGHQGDRGLRDGPGGHRAQLQRVGRRPQEAG
jgi:hypothetical protein